MNHSWTCRRRWLLLLGLFAGIALAAGCLQRPQWRDPGRMEDQQFRSVLHDPFPSPDIAPGVEGGRPPDYERPPQEGVKQQNAVQYGNVVPWGRRW